ARALAERRPTKKPWVKDDEHNGHGDAHRDRSPWNIAVRPSHTAAKKRRARKEGRRRDKFAIPCSEFARLAAVLLKPASYSQHDKAGEENYIAHPSIHQQMAEAKTRKGDKTRMARNFEDTAGPIASWSADRRGIGIDQSSDQQNHRSEHQKP